MRKAQLLTILLLLAAVFAAGAQPRREITLKKGWLFSREDNASAAQSGFNDGNWQSVTVPHDWAIYGPFDKSNDIHRMAIVQDGHTTAIEHYGRTGGLPFTGAGWYRNRFYIPLNRREAVIPVRRGMSNARVYVNGREVGYWPNGIRLLFRYYRLCSEEGGRPVGCRLEILKSSRAVRVQGFNRNVHLICYGENNIYLSGKLRHYPVVTPVFCTGNVVGGEMPAGDLEAGHSDQG